VIVIRNVGTGTKIHLPSCDWVREEFFTSAVIQKRGTSSRYYWAADGSIAEQRWPSAAKCRVCFG
jgi:hypothetical protein